VLSDGTEIGNPRYLKNSMAKVKVLQRRMDKKQKGSRDRKKAAAKVAKQHEKVFNQRNDFQHKASTSITKKYDTICVEDLGIHNMV
jgi:putative transposase